MKIEKVREERKNNKLLILFKGSNEVFANTVRRLILEEVPTLAVEDLEIKENSSALYDEMLALRIGLTPLKTDLKSYELKSKCKCAGAGCARCELKLSLKAGKSGYVYAEDAVSTDPKCIFVHPKMPLVKLLSKQKVDLTMTAILGRGREHAKWAPGAAFYKKEPVIKIGKVEDPEKIAAACPQKIFKVRNSKLEVDKDKLYDCHLCQQCTDLDKNITLEDTENLLFQLESWGQLSNKEILTQAGELLLEKAEELEKLI